jgi:hypothetical protein
VRCGEEHTSAGTRVGKLFLPTVKQMLEKEPPKGHLRVGRFTAKVVVGPSLPRFLNACSLNQLAPF